MKCTSLFLILLGASAAQQADAFAAFELRRLSNHIRFNNSAAIICASGAALSAVSAAWAHRKVKKLTNLMQQEKFNPETEKKRIWWQNVKDGSVALMCLLGDFAILIYTKNDELQKQYDRMHRAHEEEERARQERELPLLMHPNPETLTPPNRDLLQAVAAGDVNAARNALDNGADINTQANGGWAPLHAAAHTGNIAMIDLLLERGANPHLANGNDQNPADPNRKSPYEIARDQWGENSRVAQVIDRIRQTRSGFAKVNPA